MSSFANISIRISANLDQFSKEIDNASRKMQKVGRQMEQTGKTLSVGLTLPLVALGVASVKTFADFEQAMAKVKAISGATEEQFASLRKNAEDLGASTRYAASEVAELQLNFSKLGFKPDEILAATEATLSLALATGEDLAQSATVAASTIRGFGYDVSETGRVVDVMAASFSSSSLDLRKFETAMAVLAPVANTANQSLEDATGQLAVLVSAGIDASTAGTGLRNIFLDIAQKGLTLEEALDKINKSSNKNVTAMDLFGKRGATVATVLAANIDEAKEFSKQFDNAAGSAKRMADIMDNTLLGSFHKVKSAIESAFIAMGELLAPAFAKLADFAANLISKFKDLSPGTRKIIAVVGVLAAALGPVLVVLGALMTTVIPGLIAALPLLGTAFTVLTGPIGLVVAAIGAIAVVIYKNWDRIKAELVSLQNYFTDLYNESLVFRSGIESVILTFKLLWDVVKLVFGSLYEIIKNTGKYILDTFKNVGASIKAVLTGDFSSLGGIIKDQSDLMTKSFTNTFKDIGGQLGQFTDNVGKSFGDALDNVANRKKIAFVKENVDATAITEKIKDAIDLGLTGGGGSGGNLKVSGINALTSGGIVQAKSPLDNVVAEMPMQVAYMSEQQMLFLENSLEFNDRLTEIINNTAVNFAVGFGEIIGSMAAGTISAGGIGKLLVGTFADMATQVGKMAIGIGFAVEGIKTALKTLSTFQAIAAGIALVALGSFAKSALGKIGSGSKGVQIPAFAEGGIVYQPTLGLIGEYAGAKNNPEIIAPLSKLKSLIGDSGGVQRIQVEGVLRGTDMVLQQKRALNYINRRG